MRLRIEHFSLRCDDVPYNSQSTAGIMGRIFDFDMTLLTRLPSLWAVAAHMIIALLLSVYIINNKRDPRAAVAWIGLIWLSPFIGAFLFYVLGINRITRRASRLRAGQDRARRAGVEHIAPQATPKENQFESGFRPYVDQLVSRPLTYGNSVELLDGGAEAYPAMLEAIRQAKKSVMFSSYIFDRGQVAREFIAELKAARKRDVTVRVLIDAVGAHYSIPTVYGLMRKNGIAMRFFLPTLWPWQFGAFNLRNHRKLLIVDGLIGFTGGLNVRDSHDHRLVRSDKYVEDLHFKLRGPVVLQLLEVFAEDWHFASDEKLSQVIDAANALPPEVVGKSRCRAIADGPDEDFERIKWTILGAISKAKQRVWIVNPYFVPDVELIAALKIAALSGVDVRIIVPDCNNIPLVHWASQALFPGLAEVGIKIFMSRPPFDHSKLMIVDEEWSFVGSGNWDARSLRLNFEVNLEVYDRQICQQLSAVFSEREARSKVIDQNWIVNRSFMIKLRDNAARLLAPYL
jgi:cardiolipin synthase